ncbi:hypothetical protein [Georgenia deserti]|uniref:DUF4164 family protein n=1 Tax=Georgenia deserti TaxID=2093781 RepID=A0ABW4L071_9MICO
MTDPGYPTPEGDDRLPPRSIEEELEEILREAESSISALRKELAEQRLRARQHAEIDRLEEHLASTRVRWSEVRAFFDEVIDELRRRRPVSGADDPTGTSAEGTAP